MPRDRAGGKAAAARGGRSIGGAYANGGAPEAEEFDANFALGFSSGAQPAGMSSHSMNEEPDFGAVAGEYVKKEKKPRKGRAARGGGNNSVQESSTSTPKKAADDSTIRKKKSQQADSPAGISVKEMAKRQESRSNPATPENNKNSSSTARKNKSPDNSSRNKNLPAASFADATPAAAAGGGPPPKKLGRERSPAQRQNNNRPLRASVLRGEEEGSSSNNARGFQPASRAKNPRDYMEIAQLQGEERTAALIEFAKQSDSTKPPLHGDASNPFSLRNVMKWRFLNDILASVSNRREQRTYLALVVDVYTKRSLDSICESYDLFSKGVTVVENIEDNNREALPLEAVYFISPTAETLERLLADFEDEAKPKYRRAHIFLSHGITDDVMSMLTSCTPLMKRVRNFVDSNFGFVVHDSRSFHFDDPLSLLDYVPIRDPDLSKSVAERLATVCLTLNEKPLIRYLGESITCANVAHDCRDILAELYPQMQATTAKLRNENERIKDTTSTALVLILDRAIDFSVALMHDYHYESMTYDILDDEEDPPTFNVDAGSFMYEFAAGTQTDEKEVFVNDSDELWKRLKHDNIVAAKDKLFAEVKDFAANHATSRLQRGEEQDMALTKAAIRALPEYQEMLSGYYAHVALCEKNLNQLGSTNLVDVWDVEQDVTTGVDRNGNELSVRRITKNVIEICEMENVTHLCKFRLVCLFYCMVENVSDQTAEELKTAAELTPEEVDMINTMVESQLPDSPTAAFVERGKNRRKKTTMDKIKSKTSVKAYARHRQHRVKEAIERSKKNRIDEGRYISYTEEVIKQVCTGKATLADFPFVEEPKLESKRGAREQGKPKLIVFIIGGVTLAEIRAAHALSKELSYDIVIGGTGVITPRRVLDALGNAAADDFAANASGRSFGSESD